MARKALLVGINDYQGISDLRGCINDVTNMRNILKTFLGFSNNDIRLLLDARATKANIISRLNWLVRGAKSGDYLVFHFSGHGSQIRDRDGDELSDRMDELICPYDMNWDGSYITDDELRNIFKKLPQGVLLEVFMDSCHSGTGLRVVDDFGRPAELGPEPPRLEQYRVSRYLPPPPDIVARWEGEEELLAPARGFRELGRATVHHILWAGCKDSQTSADAYIAGSFNGAFTYYFCKAMRDTNGTVARSELLRRLRQSLVFNRYSQTPQLEAEATVRAMRAFTYAERRSDVRSDGRAAGRRARAAKARNAGLPTLASRATSVKLSK